MKQREWRLETFLSKFSAAATELGATTASDIESLKFRDDPVPYSEYAHLLEQLKPLKAKEVKGDYQGRAWKLTDSDGNSVIIVEHETGLEILYVAGALASIISLVPLVMKSWSRIRDHWPQFRGRFGKAELERRRFDSDGRLIEDSAPPIEDAIFSYFLMQQNILAQRLCDLEMDVLSLKSLLEKSQKSAATRNKPKRSGAAKHSTKTGSMNSQNCASGVRKAEP